MARKGFWSLMVLTAPTAAQAQQIPARDLFEFPLGSLAEAPALSLFAGDGFRNPASIWLPRTIRGRFAVSSLTTGPEQGVAGQIAAIAIALPYDATAALSIARAAVDGIVRTETDPQSIGDDVPYRTLVVSAVGARRPSPNLTAGAALRYQVGEIDTDRRSTVGIDAGVVVERVLRVDGRVALTSFLWRPGYHRGDGAGFAGAFDARLIGRDSLAQLRAGYSYRDVPGISEEHYVSASGRLGRWEAHAGLARSELSSQLTNRARFGVGLRYGHYLVGIAREESPLGLAPVYQFTLVTSIASP